MKKRRQRVLVLSPHPDDEAIGCGGTLRWHVEHGDYVEVIFLTSGERGVCGQDPMKTARIRETEAKAAAKILGYSALEFWREPDGGFRSTTALAERLTKKIHRFKPHRLYVPHPDEMHRDHRAAARLVRRALAKVPVAPDVLFYEVWTPLQHIDHVQDISAQMEKKLAAIRAHKSQCAIMRFDDSAHGLARYRGEMHSWPGGAYAEVFRYSG